MQNGPKHLQITITRSKFEQLIQPAGREVPQAGAGRAGKDAKLNPEQIDEVVLVGGSTRVPMVQRLVKELFKGKEPNKSVNPDEVVAIGAAIQGGDRHGRCEGHPGPGRHAAQPGRGNPRRRDDR
jgi:molecular chaperone DnaK